MMSVTDPAHSHVLAPSSPSPLATSKSASSSFRERWPHRIAPPPLDPAVRGSDARGPTPETTPTTSRRVRERHKARRDGNERTHAEEGRESGGLTAAEVKESRVAGV